MCIYYEINFANRTASFATSIVIAFMYGTYLRGKQFCMKIRVPNNVEDYLDMDGSSCNPKRRERTVANDTLWSSTQQVVLSFV